MEQIFMTPIFLVPNVFTGARFLLGVFVGGVAVCPEVVESHSPERYRRIWLMYRDGLRDCRSETEAQQLGPHLQIGERVDITKVSGPLGPIGFARLAILG